MDRHPPVFQIPTSVLVPSPPDAVTGLDPSTPRSARLPPPITHGAHPSSHNLASLDRTTAANTEGCFFYLSPVHFTVLRTRGNSRKASGRFTLFSWPPTTFLWGVRSTLGVVLRKSFLPVPPILGCSRVKTGALRACQSDLSALPNRPRSQVLVHWCASPLPSS